MQAGPAEKEYSHQQACMQPRQKQCCQHKQRGTGRYNRVQGRKVDVRMRPTCLSCTTNNGDKALAYVPVHIEVLGVLLEVVSVQVLGISSGTTTGHMAACSAPLTSSIRSCIASEASLAMLTLGYGDKTLVVPNHK